MEDIKGAFSIVVQNGDYGKRLDFFLAESLDDVNRSRIADCIKNKSVSVNGCNKKPSYKIRPGDRIDGVVPPLEPISFEAENISLNIIHEDDDIVVINKQAGLVVHPAPGNWTGTLVQGLLYHFPEIEATGDELRPGIVHRLDRDTSGAMVVAKNTKALFKLSEMFKSRNVVKRYIAIVHGYVKNDSGVINRPIGRHPVDRKKMSITSTKGKYAETHFHVLKRFHPASVLQCDIKTGRTHQIRVHCLSMNHPLVGDQVYALKSLNKKKSDDSSSQRMLAQATRQMLHSSYLEFFHPVTQKIMSFSVPLPIDMQDLIGRLEHVDA